MLNRLMVSCEKVFFNLSAQGHGCGAEVLPFLKKALKRTNAKSALINGRRSEERYWTSEDRCPIPSTVVYLTTKHFSSIGITILIINQIPLCFPLEKWMRTQTHQSNCYQNSTFQRPTKRSKTQKDMACHINPRKRSCLFQNPTKFDEQTAQLYEYIEKQMSVKTTASVVMNTT